ncbi:MAG TPA: YbhN family protein [Pirellulaceae bacterium]|jgi:uncharacterized membrane protein YbhN (UPF0104 family)
MIPTEGNSESPPTFWQRLGHWIGPLIAIGAFLAAALLLYRKLGGEAWPKVVAAIEGVPLSAVALAVGLTALNYVILSGYDGLAVWYLKQPLKPLRVMLVAFVGYAMSHNLTWMLGGAASRFRLYLAWGFSAVQVVKIFALIGLTFWTGFCFLAGMVFMLVPMEIPPHTHLPLNSTFWLGPILLGMLGIYLVGCAIGRPIYIYKFPIVFPPLRLAALQAIVASCDLMLQAAIAYTVMPSGYAPGYWRFANAYLLGIAAAILTHVPGGTGVLEFVVLELAPTDGEHVVDDAAIFGSLLVFRGIFFLLPLVIAIVLFLGHEWIAARKRTTAETLKH